MLDEKHDALPRKSGDPNSYRFGRIGVYNVVLACLPQGSIGTAPAGSVAGHMSKSFPRLKFRLLVGVGGGIPLPGCDIRLGDVVVSKPDAQCGGVLQYDFGKRVQGGRFKRTGSLNKPPAVLRAAVATLESNHHMEKPNLSRYLRKMKDKRKDMQLDLRHQGQENDQLYQADYDHPLSNPPTCEQCVSRELVHRIPRDSDDPEVWYGLIASGNQLIRSGKERDKLGNEENILCVEMEAAGLMDDFPCLVIRGICDYADSHKNKRWQPYAAATAAAYAKEFLYSIPAEQTSPPRNRIVSPPRGSRGEDRPPIPRISRDDGK
jgi:nucleoside phosphorylase